MQETNISLQKLLGFINASLFLFLNMKEITEENAF